ncbi:MAG: hypothetical protein ABFC98_03310, partial [Candidatus Cloacimonas sp.]
MQKWHLTDNDLLKKNNIMSTKYLLYSLITAVIIVSIYQIIAVGRVNYPEYNLKEGQVSEVEIIAPFDFPVLKSSQELAIEKEQVISGINKPYELSDEPMFEAISALDSIYSIICSQDPTLDLHNVVSDLKRNGYNFSYEGIGFVMHSSIRDKVYESLRKDIGTLYKQGIYESFPADSIFINQNGKLKKTNIHTFLSLSLAKEELAKKYPEAKTFVLEFAEQFIKPNLLVNEEKLNELSQNSLESVQPNEGM